MSNTVSTESLPTAESSGGSQRRLLMVVGGAAVLLVLGLGAYFLFLSGGEDEELGLVPRPSASSSEESKDKKDKGKDDENVPAEVDTNFAVGRDPFLPLAAEEVVEEEAPADGTTDPIDDTGGGQLDPAPTPAPAPTVKPTPAPTPTPTPTEEEVTYKVTLRSVDVAKDSAVIEVDGKRYLVEVKDMFTNSKTGPFKLTGVDERASGKGIATVVFGSDAPVELVAKNTVTFTL